MKNLVKLGVVLVVLVFMNACKSDDKPEAVAEKFLNHLNKQEWSEAKKLGTEATGQMIDMMESLSKMGGEAAKPKADVKPVTIKDTKVDGDKATCNYCCDDKGAEGKVNVVKVDGKWKVDMKKEENAGGAAPADTTAHADTKNK